MSPAGKVFFRYLYSACQLHNEKYLPKAGHYRQAVNKSFPKFFLSFLLLKNAQISCSSIQFIKPPLPYYQMLPNLSLGNIGKVVPFGNPYYCHAKIFWRGILWRNNLIQYRVYHTHFPLLYLYKYIPPHWINQPEFFCRQLYYEEHDLNYPVHKYRFLEANQNSTLSFIREISLMWSSLSPGLKTDMRYRFSLNIKTLTPFLAPIQNAHHPSLNIFKLHWYLRFEAL